jgi:hypothetical protein
MLLRSKLNTLRTGDADLRLYAYKQFKYPVPNVLTDELKKVQKEEFSAAFQKLYDHAKACICASGAYFE